MRVSELETPVLTGDLDAIERNVSRMQAYCDEHGVALRPHIKTHKLPSSPGSSWRRSASGSPARSSAKQR